MEKRIYVIFSLMAIALLGSAKATWNTPIFVYSNINITSLKVINKQNETVVEMMTSDNRGFDFLDDNCYLIDEHQNTYRMLSRIVYPRDKKHVTRAVMTFEPLAKECCVFDFVDNAYLRNQRIAVYGIHDKKLKLQMPIIDETIDSAYVDGRFFENKSTKICGHFKEKPSSLDYLVMEFPLFPADRKLNERNSVYIRIDNNGDFETNILLNHPVYTYLFNIQANAYIPCYINPGDSLYVSINEFDGTYTQIDYFGNSVNHEKLLSFTPFWISRFNFYKDENEELASRLKLADYISNKYGYSSMETHLMKNSIRIGAVHQSGNFASNEFDPDDISYLIDNDYSTLIDVAEKNGYKDSTTLLYKMMQINKICSKQSLRQDAATEIDDMLKHQDSLQLIKLLNSSRHFIINERNTYNLRQTKGKEILSSYIDKYKGKYVHMVLLPISDVASWNNALFHATTLLHDFQNGEDLALLFFCIDAQNGFIENTFLSKKSYGKYGPYDINILTDEEAAMICETMNIPFDTKEVTIDRKGDVLRKSLTYLNDEFVFRSQLYDMLDNEAIRK